MDDDRATEFARELFHELAAGQGVDRAVSAARRSLLEQGRVRIGGADALDASFALPQVYAAAELDTLLDERRPAERVERPGVRYELLGDGIRGLRSGFVGRRRVLQRKRFALRSGERTIVLLTGIGGVGKSTLTARLANRCKQDGYQVAAVQARRGEAGIFCLRLLDELATACQRQGREADERTLRDGERPVAQRLRLAVEILNEARILLVLDNLESLQPLPPAPPVWQDADFAGFFAQLTSRLTGQGRAILTCRYVPQATGSGSDQDDRCLSPFPTAKEDGLRPCCDCEHNGKETVMDVRLQKDGPGIGSPELILSSFLSDTQARQAHWELRRQGLTLDKKTVRRIAEQLGLEMLAWRRRELLAWRCGNTPVGEELAGCRVAVQIAGGRIRMRENKKTPPNRKKGQRRKFRTPWREPKVLVIFAFDEQGKMQEFRQPLIEGTLLGPDHLAELAAWHLHRLGAAKAQGSWPPAISYLHTPRSAVRQRRGGKHDSANHQPATEEQRHLLAEHVAAVAV